MRLSRVPAAGFTASIGVWGYVAGAHGAGADIASSLVSWPVALLWAIGGLAHLFGSADNEICDRELDARAPYEALKPLQSGEVSVEAAKRFTAALGAAGLALSGILAAVTHWVVLPLVGASFVLALAYNRAGKRFTGGEALFGASLTGFALAGAAAAAGPQTLLSPSVLWLAGLGLVLLTINVAYPGGLKDLDSDAKAGMRTFLGALRRAGARQGDALGLIRIFHPVPHLVVLGAASYAVAFVYARDPTWVNARLLALALLTGGRILLFARAIAADTRRKRLALGAAHEFLAVAFLPILFADAMPLLGGLLLLVAPLVFYLVFNRILYARMAAPNV